MFNLALSVFKILSPVLLLLLGVAAPALHAEPPGIEQSSDLYTDPAGDKFLRWHGHAGRSYFLRLSDSNNPLAK